MQVSIISMECRIAVESDKDDVIRAFPGIYGGTDYVPQMYDYFMACPRYTCYVGEIGGKIVAFMCTKLLDENKAYLVRSERVHADFQGQGLINQLTAYADDNVKKHLRGPEVSKKFAYNSTKENMKKLQRHPERKVIGIRALLWCTVNMPDLEQQMACFKQSTTLKGHCLDVVEMNTMTATEKYQVQKYLTRYSKAAGNALCIYWTPYGNCEDNWNDVLENTSWIATNRKALQVNEDAEQLKDMILVRRWKCQLGIRYDIEIISKGEHGIDFTTDKLYCIFRGICSEQAGFAGTVTACIFCDEHYMDEINCKVVELVGDKISVIQHKVYHANQELHI